MEARHCKMKGSCQRTWMNVGEVDICSSRSPRRGKTSSCPTDIHRDGATRATAGSNKKKDHRISSDLFVPEKNEKKPGSCMYTVHQHQESLLRNNRNIIKGITTPSQQEFTCASALGTREKKRSRNLHYETSNETRKGGRRNPTVPREGGRGGASRISIQNDSPERRRRS